MGCLEGGTTRAIDISEGDKIDAKARSFALPPR
jgi:hypothetical protein